MRYDKKYKRAEMKLYKPRKDCFAWDNEQNKCTALILNECEYSLCPFFKTKSRVEKERKATQQRLFGKTE